MSLEPSFNRYTTVMNPGMVKLYSAIDAVTSEHDRKKLIGMKFEVENIENS